tara:strand:+ start:5555 stop:6424 length:870 start_codon:yes stop_codon:yes gene_type:complete
MRIVDDENWRDDNGWTSVGIGGGDTGAILGVSPFMTAFELWEFKTKRKKRPDLSGLYHIEKGNQLEPIARLAYEKLTGYVVSPIRCIDGWRKAALDGYSPADNHIVEFKYVGAEVYQQALDGKIPPHYLSQCDHYYIVTGAATCDFVVVNPAGDIGIVEVDRNEERLKLLLKAEDKFYKAIISDIPPEKGSDDIDNISDNEFPALMAKFEKFQLFEKHWKAEKEKIKDLLTKYAQDAERSVEGAGGKVTRYWQEGSVNTKKYLEQNKIEINESFRSKGSWRYRITLEKK